MPIYGLAAGLGKLSVDSGLGEPLKAQIDLLAVTPEELSSLSAAVASEEAYALQGIPRLGVHNNIRVELAKNADGSPVLKLRSQQPIDDPYLDMLIQVDWASGRLLREYTILLDPPGYKQTINEESADNAAISKPYAASSNASSTHPSNESNASVQPVPQRSVDKNKRTKKVVEAKTQPDIASVHETSIELVTQRGDTLHSIAKEAQVEGVSLDQMLVGLFDANKNAFTGENMNRLKVGQIIKVPSRETLLAVTPQDAAKQVKLHAANWNAYANNLASNVSAAAPAEETASKQSASGKIATAQDQATPVKPGVQDVVKLSAGGKVPGEVGSSQAESDAKVLAMQEEAIAREKALKEAQSRTAALENQIADMQKLLALKNQTMSEVQKNAELSAQQESLKPVQPAAPPVSTPSTSENKADNQALAQPPAGNTATTESKDKPAAAKQPLPMPVEEEEDASFLASVLDSLNLYALGGAGGIALLGAGWFYLRNKRRKDLDSFERGILTSGGLRANTVFGNTTGNATGSSDTSFLTDFAQSAEGGMIDTNDVDPIAEAEVYMAYGRDAQAEEILKDAISKEPKRYELHLKLLEMYAARKDASAFETIAGELYTSLGADNPIWAKVAALGATIEPDNPLYDMSRVVTAAAAASSVNASQTASTDASANTTDSLEPLNFSLDNTESDRTLPSLEDADNALLTPVENQNLSQKATLDTVATYTSPATPVIERVSVHLNNMGENQDGTIGNLTTEGKLDKTDVPTDNSMDFDFPELGSFTFNTDEASMSNAQPFEAQVDVQQDATTFELPESLKNPDVMLTAATENTIAAEPLNIDFAVNAVAEKSDNETAFADFNIESPAEAVLPGQQEAVDGNALNPIDFNSEGFADSSAGAEEVHAQRQKNAALEGINLNLETDESVSLVDHETIKAQDTSLDRSSISSDDLPDAPHEHFAADSTATGNFDFSSISLDLSDDTLMQSPPASATEVLPEITSESSDSKEEVLASAENPDVDIKLDLVKVYIDMEDLEGARDLLDEVLKECGPQQRAKAEQLMASLT